MNDDDVDLCACGVPWADVPLGHVRSVSMETGEWQCRDVKPVEPDDFRAQILAAYGIHEDDPDWVALNTSSYALAEDAARASYDQFRDVVLPARVAAAEAELNATLPDGLTVKFEEEQP
jgi:hypothetical protein